MSHPLAKGFFLAKIIDGCFLHRPVLSHCRFDLPLLVDLPLPSLLHDLPSLLHDLPSLLDDLFEAVDLALLSTLSLLDREVDRFFALMSDNFSKPHRTKEGLSSMKGESVDGRALLSENVFRNDFGLLLGEPPFSEVSMYLYSFFDTDWGLSSIKADVEGRDPTPFSERALPDLRLFGVVALFSPFSDGALRLSGACSKNAVPSPLETSLSLTAFLQSFL
jgi:hypothetical protein